MTRYAPPSPEELIMAAERLGMALSADDAEMFARYGAALEFAYRRVDTLDEYLPSPDPRARTFMEPPAEENRFGAWLVKSSIKRGVDGKLAGKRIAIKDTIAVAGLPLTDGTDFIDHV